MHGWTVSKKKIEIGVSKNEVTGYQVITSEVEARRWALA